MACLSDEFERDDKCSDLYVYAKEQLMKQIGIAVIHPSMAWQSTNLGMKIGQPVRKITIFLLFIGTRETVRLLTFLMTFKVL